MARHYKSASIAESVASDGAAKELSTASVVGRGAQLKVLSPRQAYELNITARKAVTAIADQLCKAKRRLFDRKSGDEILGGKAYEFLRKNINSSMIRDMVSWWNIEGEIAVWKIGVEASGIPQKLVALDPGQMMPMPMGCFSPDAQTGWQYMYGQTLVGANGPVQPISFEIPNEAMMFIKNFNPLQPYGRMRGLSPMMAGIQEISGNYFAGRYNTSFFQNGACADLVARFPKGTARKDAEEWVKKWEAKHGVFENRSFKVTAIIGDEVQIETPGTTAKDGQFMQLRQMNSEDIGGLYGVPPSVMGFLSRTRFDTIDVELESFFENTLMPMMEIINGFVQTQLLDKHFIKNNPGERKQPKHLSKSFKRTLERTMDDAIGESDLIYVLDPDSLPIMAKLRLQQLEAADQYRRTQAVSFKDAAEWAGLDRPSNEADDLIFIDSDQQPGKEPEPVQGKDPNEPSLADAAKSLAARIKALEQPALAKQNKHGITVMRCYYRDVKAAISAGNFNKRKMEELAKSIISIAGESSIKRQLAADHLSIVKVLNSKGDIDQLFKTFIERDRLLRILGAK